MTFSDQNEQVIYREKLKGVDMLWLEPLCIEVTAICSSVGLFILPILVGISGLPWGNFIQFGMNIHLDWEINGLEFDGHRPKSSSCDST